MSSEVVYLQRCLVGTWLVSRETATVSARSVYTIQTYSTSEVVVVCRGGVLVSPSLSLSVIVIADVFHVVLPARQIFPITMVTAGARSHICGLNFLVLCPQ